MVRISESFELALSLELVLSLALPRVGASVDVVGASVGMEAIEPDVLEISMRLELVFDVLRLKNVQLGSFEHAAAQVERFTN